MLKSVTRRRRTDEQIIADLQRKIARLDSHTTCALALGVERYGLLTRDRTSGE